MDNQLDLSFINIKDYLNISAPQDAFINAILEGRFAHAYLIYGDEGVAKHRLCHLLADNILGINGEGPDKLVLSVDSIKKAGLSTATSSMGVTAIRDMLVPFISALSMLGSKRVVIIEHAELLTAQAQNALLKPLEYSRDDIVFFIICNDTSKILTTVKSRCIKVPIHRWTNEKISNLLIRGGVDGKYAVRIAQRSAGLVVKAIDFISNTEEVKNIDIAIDRLFNLSSYTDIISFACEYAKADEIFRNDLLDIFEQKLQAILHNVCNMNNTDCSTLPKKWQTIIEKKDIFTINNIIRAVINARHMKNMQTNWQSVLDSFLASVLEETTKWQLQ